MPVVYLAGFNGSSLDHATQMTNLTSIRTASSTAMVLGSASNGINRLFGQFDQNDSAGPVLSFLHMRNANTDYGGSYVTMSVGASATDPTVASMAINGNVSATANWWAGWGATFAALGFTSATSFRVGFRLYRSNSFNENPVYISDVTTTARSHYRLSYTPVRGSEKYWEIEWLAASKTLNLYVDDELVMTSGPGFTTYTPWTGISVFANVTASGTTYHTSFMEFKDLYVQTIESDADVRLGSATRVWPFIPTEDDFVQYQRPAGYNTNASVAAGTMYADPVPAPSTSTAYLSATAVDQADSYRTNADSIVGKLETIEAVQVRGFGMNPLSGTRTFTARAEVDGAAAETTPSSVPFNSGFRLSRLIMPATPGGARWSAGTVAGLKIGTKVKS